jgi:DNA modification methylase
MTDLDAILAAGGPWKRAVRIGGQLLIEGDCREVMAVLPKVDAVVTDPPYGIGADKAKAQSSIRDNPKWEAKSWDAARPSERHFDAMLSAAPRLVIWGGNYFADMLPASSGWLSWRKPEAESGFSLADIELAWTSLAIAARQITLPRRDGNVHPTQKPVALMEWCLGFLPDARTILDPFMGSGTTLVACQRFGRQGIGIELDPGYFDTACKRVQQVVDNPPLFTPEPPKPQQEAMNL